MDDQQRARQLLPADAIRNAYEFMGEEKVVPVIVAVETITAALRAAPEVLHIQVRNNGEYGSFYLREGVEGEGDRRHYWCELTCNTSFGTVGHYWSSMGGPAARFLAKLNRGYLIGKLWGSEATVFCGDYAVEQAKAALLRERRDRDLSKEDAREAFDAFWNVNTEFEWHQMVLDCDWLHRHLMECGGPFGSVTNPQAQGFWEALWPAFLAQLNATHPVLDVRKTGQP